MNQAALFTALTLSFITAALGQSTRPPGTPLPPQPLAPPTATSPISPNSNTSTGGVVAINLATGAPVSASEWAAGAPNPVPPGPMRTNALPGPARFQAGG